MELKINKSMTLKIETRFQKEKIGIGRRKQAVARVFLNSGQGNILINLDIIFKL